MYYYEEEFCGNYRQLMPVVYEKKEDGKYHKVRMSCTNSANCELDKCKHFKKAPDTLTKNELRDTLIGRRR